MDRFAREPPVEVRLGDALTTAEGTVATAESFTGGLTAALLTGVPGASGYFDRGVVTYTDRAKMAELGVRREALEAAGAVSGAVAEQMARGVRDRTGATWGVATTGLAGPPDREHARPTGTAYVGVARGPPGGAARASVQRYEFEGGRNEVRERGARRALWDLYAAVVSWE